ncbi:hypothetical protein [Haloplasma contractile]|uniref:ABC-2 domain containing protein n=1 Tax=Haloplasma contractile SSD-17B TaxID=1033810 RepID=U2DUB5_9MOLU|nr:hypothetical protein [Haloplasma contractile]ERJ12002.1 ABC-2 domain containing protein [Haloplasma contractile SSD-17B]
MVRVVLWELRKIVERKIVWVLILLCVVLAFVFEGTSSYRYEYGKQFDERDLYRYSIELEKKYPGALNQYSDQINEHYNELNNQYEALVRECTGNIKDCKNEPYIKFMTSKKIYDLLIYKDLKNAIEEVDKRNQANYTRNNNTNETLAEYMNEQSPLKSKFIALKIERLEDLEKEKPVVFINHEFVVKQYIDGVVFYSFLLLIILVVALIPVFAYDYDYRTNYLIGSSKTGRQLVFSKIIASLFFGVVIYTLFFIIHSIRFMLNNKVQSIFMNPLYDLNNNDFIPWRDITLVEFIIYYWGYIFVLIIISILIILLISRLTKRVMFGVIFTVFYFIYPFLIDNLLRFNLKFKYRYIVNYLNISKVFAHSDRLLIIGDPYQICGYEYQFWGRDVIILNASLLILLLGYTSYRFIKKIDFN